MRGKALARQTLAWLDSAGHTQPLLAAAATYGTLAFSPEGKRLAVGMYVDNNFDMWVCEWERDRKVI